MAPTLESATSRAVGLRPAGGAGQRLIELTVYVDACPVVAPYNYGSTSTNVLPQWRELAKESLDFVLYWVKRFNFDVVCESSVVSGFFQQHYPVTFVRVGTALPRFGETGLAPPPGRFAYLGETALLVMFTDHPSAYWTHAQIRCAFFAQVRTHLARSAAGSGLSLAASHRGSGWWQACMLCARLDTAQQHLYDGVFDDSVHERYTALCRRLQAEHPELFAAVLAVFYGSGRAAVRRGFYARLDPQAARACVAFLARGASRVYTSVMTMLQELPCGVLERLLRCEPSAFRTCVGGSSAQHANPLTPFSRA
jgi:hypothetical protein